MMVVAPLPPLHRRIRDRIREWWDHRCRQCWRKTPNGLYERLCEAESEGYHYMHVNAQTGEQEQGIVPASEGCRHRHHRVIVGIA